MKIIFIILIIFINTYFSNCLYKWQVPLNYRKLTKAFIKKQEQLTHYEIQTFLTAIFKMDVDEDEETLMAHLAKKYKESLFPGDEEESFDGKQIVGYFKEKYLEEFVEEETRKIYDTLIDYYDIRDDIDEEMYEWITDGKTDLFGFTLENYLLAIENVSQLIEVNESEMETELEEAVYYLEQEFNEYPFQQNKTTIKDTNNNTQNQDKQENIENNININNNISNNNNNQDKEIQKDDL